MSYFPLPHPAWDRAEPASSGVDPNAIAAAARFAAEHETPWRRDLAHMIATDFGEEPPWNERSGRCARAAARMASYCARAASSPNGAIPRRSI